MNNKILIIQTAFIGDVILATSLVESVRKEYPTAQIDFLLRKGNEAIIIANPQINQIFIWDKKKGKFSSLLRLLFKIRKEKYSIVLNIQRFFNSGLLTALSGAPIKIGFHSNPLSMFFSKSITHKIPHKEDRGNFLHEVQRNYQLMAVVSSQGSIPEANSIPPKIYFSPEDIKTIEGLNLPPEYIVMAPSSVWFTKQWHQSKWKELIESVSKKFPIFLIGAPTDQEFITPLCLNPNVHNLCGKLNLRESALLMKKAKRVFVNDSAPLHLASSVNAKVTAIFCSTVPDFGYYPLTEDTTILQVEPRLSCMPCGLHGHKKCPKQHFKCAMDIPISRVQESIT